MKFQAYIRQGQTKGETNKIRSQGDLPAVLYGPNFTNKNIFLKGAELKAILRNITTGTLGSTVFSLDLDGEKHQVIIKDIQYKITTYEPIHVDFEVTEKNVLVNVNIPIRLTNSAECQGVKLGGVLRTVIRYLKVRCLPKEIPSHFELDVKNLNIGQSLRLSDIDIPEQVTPIAKMNEVAVVVAKR
jgi:large subunit ribosomal protein L25